MSYQLGLARLAEQKLGKTKTPRQEDIEEKIKDLKRRLALMNSSGLIPKSNKFPHYQMFKEEFYQKLTPEEINEKAERKYDETKEMSEEKKEEKIPRKVRNW